MRAGDGYFVNSNCDPCLHLHSTYFIHDATVNTGTAQEPQQQKNLRSVISLFKHLRYVCFKPNHLHHQRSPIKVHDQITVFYNSNTNGLLNVREMIGGCFYAHKCRCGAPFCCGEIVTRLRNNCLTESDRYFFPVTTGDSKVWIDYEKLHKANMKWRDLFQHHAVRDQKSEFCKMNCIRALEWINDEPIEVLTLMEQFKTSVPSVNVVPLRL